VDVRIVAASNQDLAGLVREKRFREDLYYRLNVITITAPPLRERREDVAVLAQHFLRIYAAKNNRRLEGFTDDALGCLEAYGWPGNVRELENVVERAVVLARGTGVEVTDLPETVAQRSVMLERPEPGEGTTADEGFFRVKVGTSLAEVEQRILEETLRLTKGNKTLTAKLLGIDPKTVFRKLKAGEADEAAAEERAGT
jgi:two-component system response regulator HydG